MQEPLEELRSKVALSCRILAMMGLVKEITGHVSVRIPGSDQMFIRCRGVDEYGLPFTSTEAVQPVDFDGDGPDASRFGRMRDVNYEVPAEFPIHGEILPHRRRWCNSYGVAAEKSGGPGWTRTNDLGLIRTAL